ncbi:neurofilament heavy polypeptide-like [Ctenopharyngodon idella]|uniref:neurofilament heavy polypeptide-like n=1 Tax=Ctenopharyngodon idella TaxID=7959 RepID=UPI00222E4EBE|nr:neurofilament heavy polypeptide-like [Ctenopharyngodon idella]
MSVSSIPTMFSESPEQSSSSEFSDELTTALAEGRWWAIMEVSDPISEENEYVDLISGQWGDTLEAGETSWPTSLAFSDASEKAQRTSQHSDFADETLKTSKQWRQKTMPFSARSKQGAPVSSSSEKGDLTSPPVFSGASEKALNSGFSDAALKTTKKRKKQRQKKSQGAPGSGTTEGRKLTSFPVFTDGSEKAESPQWRQKPQKAPDGSTQEAHVLVRSQQNSAGSKKVDLTSSLVFSDASEKPEILVFSVASLKERDQRRKWRKKKPQVAPVPVGSPQEPHVPVRSQHRGKLKIPDHLVKHLQKASSELGAPFPSRSQQGVSPQETPKSLQRAPVAAPNGAPMNDKIPKRQKLKIPEPLRRELLQQKPLASSLQGVSIPAKFKQDTTVPDRTPVEALVHAGTQQGASSLQAAPVSAESPKGAAVSAPSTQGAPMPSRIAKVAPMHSGTPQGAHVPAGSPQQEANFRIPMQWREQWRQQNTPKGVSVLAKTPHRTLTSDNAGVDQSPPQKLYVEIYNKVQLNLKLRSHNHQLHQRTWSHLNRKRALDNAGVDQSPPPKKPCMDQQLEQEQIEDLCRMFTKFCAISHI